MPDQKHAVTLNPNKFLLVARDLENHSSKNDIYRKSYEVMYPEQLVIEKIAKMNEIPVLDLRCDENNRKSMKEAYKEIDDRMQYLVSLSVYFNNTLSAVPFRYQWRVEKYLVRFFQEWIAEEKQNDRKRELPQWLDPSSAKFMKMEDVKKMDAQMTEKERQEREKVIEKISLNYSRFCWQQFFSALDGNSDVEKVYGILEKWRFNLFDQCSSSAGYKIQKKESSSYFHARLEKNDRLIEVYFCYDMPGRMYGCRSLVRLLQSEGLSNLPEIKGVAGYSPYENCLAAPFLARYRAYVSPQDLLYLKLLEVAYLVVDEDLFYRGKFAFRQDNSARKDFISNLFNLIHKMSQDDGVVQCLSVNERENFSRWIETLDLINKRMFDTPDFYSVDFLTTLTDLIVMINRLPTRNHAETVRDSLNQSSFSDLVNGYAGYLDTGHCRFFGPVPQDNALAQESDRAVRIFYYCGA